MKNQHSFIKITLLFITLSSYDLCSLTESLIRNLTKCGHSISDIQFAYQGKKSAMKKFQGQLDLQHFDQHLKDLRSIKTRALSYTSLNSSFRCHTQMKNRSKTFGKKIKDKQSNVNSNTNISFKQQALSKEGNKHNRCENFRKNYLAQKFYKNKRNDKQNTYQKNRNPNVQSSGTSKFVKINNQQSLKLNNVCVSDEHFNKQVRKTKLACSKFRSSFYPIKKRLNQRPCSTKIIEQIQTCSKIPLRNDAYSVQNKQNYLQINVNEQAVRHANNFDSLKMRKNFKLRKNRSNELQKYLRFSEQSLLSIHHFILEIRVTQMQKIHNNQLFSFWIEAKTFKQNIKSSFFTFEQLTRKPIFLSFISVPKKVIQITIKYFRKLQTFTYGQSLILLQDQCMHNQEVVISNNNTSGCIKMRVSAKIIDDIQERHSFNRFKGVTQSKMVKN